MFDFNYHLIDLTHTLNKNIPGWNGSCGFFLETKLDYQDYQSHSKTKFRVQQFKLHAGIGTHLDLPAHCIENGKTAEDILLSECVLPCVVIDITHLTHERYSLSVDDIKNFEQQYHKIMPKTFVIIKTGWEKYINNPEKYHNNYIFPSISESAAQWLLERNISGIGIDTLSPDRPENGFPVHQLLLSQNKYIVENVANLDQLPITNSFVLIAALKIKEATEVPIRLMGLVKK